MNRRVWIVSLSVVVLIGVLASLTWCCMDIMMKRHMTQGAFLDSETWPRVLNLTADQRLKINPLEANFKKEIAGLQADLATKEIRLCRLMMTTGKPDAKAMQEALNEVSSLRKQKDEVTLNHLIALREVLNPDQQKKLYTTLMQDICIGCRQGAGEKTDYCGLCNIK